MTKHTLRLSLLGRPYSKKNRPQVYCPHGCRGWRRGQGPQPKKIVRPSREYLEYEERCLQQLLDYANIQFTTPVVVNAHYWMPDRRSRPDLSGLIQATGDILEKSGILQNDRLISSWGTSVIMGVDPNRPRADIEIVEV